MADSPDKRPSKALQRRQVQPALHFGPDGAAAILDADAWDMLHFEKALYGRGLFLVAGLDEAGRGPLAGPVLAAAVILPAGIRYEGLTDSKLLRTEQRERWFARIRESAVAYAVASVSERQIESVNILVASRMAMEQALLGLSAVPQHLLVDGIVPLHTRLPQQCVKHGDRLSQSIAAASVLAKVTRDRLMDGFHEQYPQYNFRQNKGYATPEHLEALRKHGCCPLHRRSFHGVLEVTPPLDQDLLMQPMPKTP